MRTLVLVALIMLCGSTAQAVSIFDGVDAKPGLLIPFSSDDPKPIYQFSKPFFSRQVTPDVEVRGTIDLNAITPGWDKPVTIDKVAAGASIEARLKEGVASIGITWTTETKWGATVAAVLYQF